MHVFITQSIKVTAAEVRVDETIDLVKASSSVAYTFTAVPEFHEPGVNTIEVGLLVTTIRQTTS